MSVPFEDLPADFADALANVRSRIGRLGTRVLYFPTIGSTNEVGLRLAAHGGAEGAIVVADTQTAGRGRRGRNWFSPPASGLYVSLVLDPAQARGDRARATALLTLAAGVALAESVHAATGLGTTIKWPNDLTVDQRKVAGILAEGVARQTPEPSSAVAAVVLGYGINVGRMRYPRELEDRATSLEHELGRPIDRAALWGETLVAMARRYDDLLAGRFDAILDAWRARAPASRGARVTWQGTSGARSGITAGIDEDGRLLVGPDGNDGNDGNDGTIERLVAGEVTWM